MTQTMTRSVDQMIAEYGRTQFRAIHLGSDLADMEFRADVSKREFDGIAVPWDTEIDVDGWAYEVWRNGAFSHQLRAAFRVKVGDGHIPLGGSLIGRLDKMVNDAKGLRVTGKISKVPDGDNVLTLMGDRALDELSIGFYRVPGGDSITRKADSRPLYEMTRADLFEVALVPFGAYGRKAKVDAMRAAQMDEQGRERIEVSGGALRSLTLTGNDGQTAMVPFAGNLADAVRTLLGPISPAPVAPEPVTESAPAGPDLSAVDAVLADLPPIELPTE